MTTAGIVLLVTLLVYAVFVGALVLRDWPRRHEK